MQRQKLDYYTIWYKVRPKLAREIILERQIKIYKEEVRSERSKDPKVRSLDQLEAVGAEHREKSGTDPKWLKQDMEG